VAGRRPVQWQEAHVGASMGLQLASGFLALPAEHGPASNHRLHGIGDLKICLFEFGAKMKFELNK
jgi:hypothetical protein